MSGVNPVLFERDARRRGLKGIIRRVKPAVDRFISKGYNLRGRRNFMSPAFSWKGKWGTCKWCAEPTEPRRLWHWTCILYYNSASATPLVGTQVGDRWEHLMTRDAYDACHLCGEVSSYYVKINKGILEMDHAVAIGVAIRQGVRQLLRTYLPENLQLLCHQCHASKTKADRYLMQVLDQGYEQGRLGDDTDREAVLHGLDAGQGKER